MRQIREGERKAVQQVTSLCVASKTPLVPEHPCSSG